MSVLIPYLEAIRGISDFGAETGFVQTHLPGVRFFWSDKPIERGPLLYDAGMVIIGQGYKIGYLDNNHFRYDEDHYLISSVPMPFECETWATSENPLLGIFIDIDRVHLNKLVAKINKYTTPPDFDERALYQGIEPVKMDPEITDATIRLLKCLRSPVDSDTLGNSIVNEIIYRAFMGEHGPALYALTHYHSKYACIARVLTHIHENYMKPLSVTDLAENGRMSTSSFHRAFKKTTGQSPLQYLKKVRLNKAKSLMLHADARVGIASQKVGYESLSQFSREFKRYFNISPKKIKESR